MLKPLIEPALRIDGLSYYAIVTTWDNANNFKADDLAGFGDDYFNDWYVYVVRDAAGLGAAPQNELQPISNYVSADGTFTHTAFTVDLTVNDEVLILHESLASILVTTIAGKTQILEVSVTSAANAGNVTVGTITTGACLIKSVVLHSDSAQTTDLASAAIYGGAGNVITFISAVEAAQANLDAVDRQISWQGAVRLNTGKVITIDLVGTGVTAVDLTVIIEYEGTVNGAHIV